MCTYAPLTLLPLIRMCHNTVPPPGALRPSAGHGLLILEVSRSHTMTHHSRQDSCGRVISSSKRPLPDNTQHSQQTNIHAPGGIRTHDLRSRAAADLRLRQRGHWDRLLLLLLLLLLFSPILHYTAHLKVMRSLDAIRFQLLAASLHQFQIDQQITL